MRIDKRRVANRRVVKPTVESEELGEEAVEEVETSEHKEVEVRFPRAASPVRNPQHRQSPATRNLS
ncbi:hypothetical protein CRE_13694 [Caenorhabditis remanei]|uniref:Uncharacterized protein n=1 Tax=Caenorhabditis remanei TaxID=31234 RepID=E3N7L5_CAERE|nr:hypothetical protein CRE_13694 [Caenorhabditis remanei]